MAITAIEYSIIKRLRDLDKLPLASSILEIGESNWYGDIPLEVLGQDIYAYGLEHERENLFCELSSIAESRPPSMLFDIAKIWYRTFFHACPTLIIDQDGPNELKLDLNQRIKLDHCYDCVIDFGTAEHIFNVYQFFENVHRWTKVGGLMIHGIPFSGWYDHGFYNFNPTFFWDLARSNSYSNLVTINATLNPLSLLQLGSREAAIKHFQANKIPDNSLIYSFIVKTSTEDFRVPQQYVYDKSVQSAIVNDAWRTLRG